jgi:glycosyltransferase involved in cell wall biosynthesis
MKGLHQPAIAFVSWAPFFSGAERALLITATALTDAGHRVSVVVGTDGELKAHLEARGIPVTFIPLPYVELTTLLRVVPSAMALARWFRREGAQVVHSNDAPSFQLAGYVARFLRVPSVCHLRFVDTREGFSWFLKSGFTRALFVSDYLRRDAEAAAPEHFIGRSDVVYDGVELPSVSSEDERACVRQSLGIPNDRPTVLFAGQVVEIKGIFDYIDAIALLVSRGVRAAFVVMGDDLKGQGAGRREAEARARIHGIADHVHFLGYQRNAPDLVGAFDVVAVPSHIEPLGNATLEAMAAARPVVGSRVGGIPEMIVDGVTGLMVPAHTPEALADALGRLIGDPTRARMLGQAGRDRAASVFSVQAHAARLGEIYRAVVAS